jgi:hypothetical protein
MKLIKIYGKEDMSEFVKLEIAKEIRKIKKEMLTQMKEMIEPLENELILIKIKLGDIEKIVEIKDENKEYFG